MELGKDIIAVDPDGIVCAFQLKTATNGKISISDWRKINNQVIDLATLKIIHPSIKPNTPHKSYFVTNGVIDEEVQRAIQDLSNSLKERHIIEFDIETVVKGQLLSDFLNLEDSLLPSELDDFKAFLELYFYDGKDILPRKKLSLFFESVFQLDKNDISKQQCVRIISGGALLCSLCTTNFCNSENYLAEIQAWTIFLSYCLSLSEKNNIRLKDISEECNIAIQTIYFALENLVEELMKRNTLIEGDSLVDHIIYRTRINWLVALLSIYGLWRKTNNTKNETDLFIQEFVKKHYSNMVLWGEGSVPQFLAFYWYFIKINSTPEPDFKILYSLIETISKSNQPREKIPLHNVYYLEDDIINGSFGFLDKPINDSFNGNSYTLESLLYLFVRRWWKQNTKYIWPDISRLSITFFQPDNKYDFYRWSNKNGITIVKYLHPTQNWSDLLKMSEENDTKNIPEYLKDNIIFCILFLCVFPQRINSDIVRWIDSNIN